MKYAIGTTFKTRGKHKKTCTVIDFYTTTNIQGQVVAERYVCTRELMGQTITDRNVVQTSIDMGLTID